MLYHNCPANPNPTRPIVLFLRELGLISTAFDLNAKIFLSPFPCVATPRGVAHAHRPLCFLAADGFPAQGRVRSQRRAISGQSTDAGLLVSGSVSLPRVRSVDVSRKPARHRDVPASSGTEALPRRISWQSSAQYPRRCELRSRLAYLRRLRSGADRPGADSMPTNRSVSN